MSKGRLGNSELLRHLMSGSVTDLMVKLNGDDGEAWQRELARFLRKEPTWATVSAGTEGTYPTIIDYSLSLATMIKAGEYDWIDDEITEKQFRPKGKGIVKHQLVLCHYGLIIETGKIMKLMAAAGLKESPIEDLLAFGATYPEEQRKYSIIALGSTVGITGNRDVPCLNEDGSKRSLNLHWYAHRWPVAYRFLARKVSVAQG